MKFAVVIGMSLYNPIVMLPMLVTSNTLVGVDLDEPGDALKNAL
jgi:hypothetical protein